MMGRVLRGLGALLVMVAGLAGIPYALWGLRGNPLPQRVSWTEIVTALTSRDDGQLLIGLITWVGWIAWAIFAAALVAETVAQLSGRQLTIPGLGAPRLVVAPLVAAVLAVAVLIPLANPQPATTAPASPNPASVVTRTQPAPPLAAQPDTPNTTNSTGATGDRQDVNEGSAQIRNSPVRAESAPQEAEADRDVTHTVRSGETLWGLAQQYYGAGSKWRTIAAANAGLVGADGWLDRGWVITIPDVPADTAKPTSTRQSSTDRQAEPGTSYQVEKGESLSEISREAFGTPGRWDEVWDANKDSISNPDQIEIGQKLDIPGTKKSAAKKDKSQSSKSSKPKDSTSKNDAGADKAPGDAGKGKSSKTDPDKSVTGNAGKDEQGKDRATQDRADRGEKESDRQDQQPGTDADVTGAQPETRRPDVPSSAPAPQSAPEQPIAAKTTPADSDDGVGVWEVSITGAAALMAAGLLSVLVARRRRRAFSVMPGRRLPAMSAPTREAVAVLRQVEQPLTVEHLDRALRSMAASLAEAGEDLPLITAIRLADDRIDLRLLDPDTDAPQPFTSDAGGNVWTLLPDRADELLDGADSASVPAPYPALVTLGRDSDGAHLLVDVETLGALQVEDGEVLAAIAFELATSTWADDVAVTLVGVCPELPEALGVDRLRYAGDLDVVLEELEREAAETSAVLAADGIADPHHGRVTAAAELTPHLLLVGQPMHSSQVEQLEALLRQQPRIAVAAITPEDSVGEWSLREGMLNPAGLAVEPQRLNAATVATLCAAARESQSETTEPAPWWDHEAVNDIGDMDPDLTEVAVLPTSTRTESAGAELDDDAIAEDTTVEVADPVDPDAGGELAAGDGQSGEADVQDGEDDGHPVSDVDDGAVMARLVDRTITSINPLLEIPHPVLMLLGEVSLGNVGDGQLSTRRGVSELLEPIAFVHLNPARATTAFKRAMAHRTNDVDALASRARRFLGYDDEGARYFPTATRTDQGRAYQLHEGVTSDWAYLNTLIDAGVNMTSTQHLVQALRLVRGRPLDSVPGGGWPWADDFVETATSIIVAIAHQVAQRALTSGDYATARWALHQGRQVDPLTEVLARDELQLERLAGSPTAARRVADRIYNAARSYQVSLDPETLSLLHEMGDQRRYRGA